MLCIASPKPKEPPGDIYHAAPASLCPYPPTGSFIYSTWHSMAPLSAPNRAVPTHLSPFHAGQRGVVASMRDGRTALARSAASMHSRCIVSCSIPTAVSHAATLWGHAELFNSFVWSTYCILVCRSAWKLPTLLGISIWLQLDDPAVWARWLLLCITYCTTYVVHEEVPIG